MIYSKYSDSIMITYAYMGIQGGISENLNCLQSVFLSKFNGNAVNWGLRHMKGGIEARQAHKEK